MENNYNIEELFKANLQNMEAQPPAGGWEAIQAKMGLSNTVVVTTAAKTGLGFAKIAAIITVAVGTGLGVGYFAFKGDDETNNKQQSALTTNNSNNKPQITNNSDVVIPEDVKLTEINSVNKNGKVVSIVEVQKGNEKQKVLVEYTQSNTNNNSSIVGQWLSNKENKYSQDLINKLVQQLESNDEEVNTVENNATNNNEVKVQKLEQNEVIAGIKVSTQEGPAPLTVEFGNLTTAESYEWNFGDNNSAKNESPRHIYTEPGNYVVILSVKDNSGKTFTDKVLIVVNAKTDVVTTEESSMKTYNVFTPNGDGENDELVFEGKGIEAFQVQIFDINGKLVYSSTDLNQTWNGNDKSGNLAAKGTYSCAYKAIGKDKKEYKKTYSLQLNR